MNSAQDFEKIMVCYTGYMDKSQVKNLTGKIPRNKNTREKLPENAVTKEKMQRKNKNQLIFKRF